MQVLKFSVIQNIYYIIPRKRLKPLNKNIEKICATHAYKIRIEKTKEFLNIG